MTIIAHRRYAGSGIDGVRILPHFSASTYATMHKDPVTGAMDDWRAFDDLLQSELALLPRPEFRPADAVLVPTATENHLAGYIGWMKTFDPLEAPLFLLHLMFPSGITVDAAGCEVVEDPLRALFYRLADRAAQEEGPPVHLFASGGQHATEFSALFRRPVAAHPLPIRPEPGPAADGRPKRALLFAGDARVDKGVGLLPALVPLLAAAHPAWSLVAHVNGNTAWGEARAAVEALQALPATVPGLDLSGGRLSADDYLALARGVGIALFPYDPVLYRRKSSGVLWEAISLGTPVVVPAGTWLENEARYWGAGHVAYAEHSAAGIAAAFAAALPRIDELGAASAAAAARYRAANGASALIDQIAGLWVRHKAAASLVARPGSLAIDLTRLDGGWHRPEPLDGRTVRWAMQEPTISFDWPFEEPWQLDISLLSFFGEEQLDRIELHGTELPATLSWQRDGRGARLAVRGQGPGRAKPRIDLRLRLPYTYRPPNDSRDLGVLVGAMQVGLAASAGGGASAASDPSLAPVLRITGAEAPSGGWRLAPAVGGVLVAAADRPCAVAFRLRCEPASSPPIVMLELGGAAARLHLTPEAEGVWLGMAMLPPALLRAAGDHAGWELACEPAEGQAVTLLSATASRLAGTTRPLAEADAPAMPPPAPVAPVAAPPPGVPRLRWDLSQGLGPTEGPFPDLDVPADVRWVVARDARLVVEADAAGPAQLTLRYRCLLPRQGMRVTLEGGSPTEVEIEGAGLRQSGEVVLDLMLQAGANDVALAFSGGGARAGDRAGPGVAAGARRLRVMAAAGFAEREGGLAVPVARAVPRRIGGALPLQATPPKAGGPLETDTWCRAGRWGPMPGGDFAQYSVCDEARMLRRSGAGARGDQEAPIPMVEEFGRWYEGIRTPSAHRAFQHLADLIEDHWVVDRRRHDILVAVGDLAQRRAQDLAQRVLGSRATTRASLKAATGPMRSRTMAISSRPISPSAVVTPCLSTTRPSGTWPFSVSRTPTTAHSATSGWAASTSSIAPVERRWPATLMMSSVRDITET